MFFYGVSDDVLIVGNLLGFSTYFRSLFNYKKILVMRSISSIDIIIKSVIKVVLIFIM